MRKSPPPYFSKIVEESKQRWQRLENDPGLKGPWDRLFQQVLQPDHVISELLQNADDAGATWARMSLLETAFVFEHNGQDFDETSLRAISSFAQSNKTILHTIGQWGIGFKSVFSWGPRVEIVTPSLAFAFDKETYIIPQWLDNAEEVQHTKIRIILDNARRALIQKQIEAWKADALSLLFFRTIEKLEITSEVFRIEKDAGPTPQSQWVLYDGKGEEDFLLIAREAVSLAEMPDDVRQDIQSQIPGGQAFPEEVSFPISLVAGKLHRKRFYVVLPTRQSIVSLPCVLNAPFIQDPGRTGILPPAQSPANRWFLERLGKLAARTLQQWLQNSSLPLSERAAAYTSLLPKEPQAHKESIDAAFVEPFLRAFEEEWKQPTHRQFLSAGGELCTAREIVGIPAAFFDVWDSQTLQDIFVPHSEQKLLSPEIPEEIRKRLKNWHPDWTLHTVEDAFNELKNVSVPRPRTWEHLMHLWRLVVQAGEKWWPWKQRLHWKSWPLLPVQGQSALYPAEKVMPPLGEKEKQFSEDELAFMLPWVNLVEKGWWQYIAALPKEDPIHNLKKMLGLPETTSKEPLFQTAARNFFNQPSHQWETLDGLRWAWIAARMNIPIPKEGFYYLCRDGNWYSPESTEILDGPEAELEDILPPSWLESHVLHEDYWRRIPPEHRPRWEQWVGTDKSRLQKFIRVQLHDKWIEGLKHFEETCRKRGGHPLFNYPRKRHRFLIEDFEFDDGLWDYWEHKASLGDSTLWVRITRFILQDWEQGNWEQKVFAAGVYQYSQSNPLDVGKIHAHWIVQLREKPCVLGEDDQPHRPHEVYRRNQDTEALRGTVVFMHPDFDTPSFDAFYRALGVPDHPKDAGVFLQRLQHLAQVSPPPIGEVGKLYDRIALLFPNLPPSARQALKTRFAQERLLWGEDGAWHKAADIYQRNPEALPGVVVVHPDLPSDLSELWHHLEIPLEPSWHAILEWLRQLPKERALTGTTLRRLRRILRARPQQVWEETGHWLNGQNEWVSTQQLRYAATEPDLRHLFPHVKRQCANVSMLPQGVSVPLPSLASVLEYRPDVSPRPLRLPPEWLEVLADFLGRVILESEDETQRVAGLSQRLRHTSLQKEQRLQVIAYLKAEPIGRSFTKRVLWHDHILYFTPQASYEHLTEEIGRWFPDNLKKAIHAMWKRPRKEIQRYFEHWTFDKIGGIVSDNGYDQTTRTDTIPTTSISAL